MPIRSQYKKLLAFVMIAAVTLSASDWRLPRTTVVKDSGPRTYRLTVEYINSNTQGKVASRQQVVGEYTRGLPGGDAVWNNVTVVDAPGPDRPFGVPQKRQFMDGFRYHKGPDASGSMSPDFFKGFPPTAVQERDLAPARV